MRISDWSSDVCSSDLFWRPRLKLQNYSYIHFSGKPMSAQNQNNQENQESQEPSFSLQRTYIKDLSLEMPNAPQIFLEQETPTVEVSINVGGQRLAETVYEATVTATVTTRIQDKVLYLVE